MHLHILGICGTFMGSLAALAREAGHRVTGCDAGVYPPMSDQLRALGIDLIEGWSARAAGAEARCLRGRQRGHARQCADGGDPRRRRCPTPAARSGWPNRCCRAAMCWPWPAPTARPRRRRCWPGSWTRPGCSRVSWSAACRRTSASRRAWATGPCRAAGGIFVIEADEYDTAFFDKRSKFVHYRPRTAILNNLEFDHADIFPTWPPSRPSSTTWCAPCRQRPAGGQCARRGAGPRAGARLLERGAALRRPQGVPACCAHAATRRTSTCCAAACAWPMSTGRCWASTTSSMRWPPSPRPNMSAWPPRWPRGAGTLRKRAPPARTARHGRRRQRLRRLRAPPDGDPHDDRRAAAQGRPGAHPGGLRAALEHHEARRHGGLLPWSLEEADLAFCHAAIWAGTPPPRWRRWASASQVFDELDPGARRVRGRPPGRPRAVHEQRRLRRRARQAAGATRRLNSAAQTARSSSRAGPRSLCPGCPADGRASRPTAPRATAFFSAPAVRPRSGATGSARRPAGRARRA
jgi:hypothetical protein